MTSFVELVGEMLCIALDFHNQLNFAHIPTSVASSMMAAVIYKRVLCNMDTRASHAMLHAVITVSLHCRTTAGVCVEMHTALRHSIVRLMMGNVETIVPMMISFVGLAGAMQCTALECHRLSQQHLSQQHLSQQHLNQTLKTQSHILGALLTMAAVIYKRVLGNMDTRASHAMLHAVITVSLHCRTTAGVCVEMHTALRHSIVRLMMGNVETIVPMMISFVGLAGAMQCTALECRAWV